MLLILFLSREGENLYSIQKNSYQTKVIVELALTLENIAHQHALERGLTAGFLGLNDTKGKHKIFNQRKKSDQSVDDLEDFFNTRQSDLKNININANVEKLTYLLEQKKLVRSKIDQLASDHNAFNYYSSVNKKIIDTIDLLIVLVGDNTLHGELNSMVEMVRLKERAGQIRGALNEVYSKGTATVGAYTRIYTLIKDFDKTLALLINNRNFNTK